MSLTETSIAEVSIAEGASSGEFVFPETVLFLEQRPVMLIGQAAFRADMGEDFAGSQILTILERVGWAIESTDRNGVIVSNPSRIKLLREIWPIIRGTVGDVVDIYAGYQFTPEDEVIWQGPFPFEIGVDKSVQPLVEGPYLAIRFQSLGISPWALLGVELDIDPTGEVYA